MTVNTPIKGITASNSKNRINFLDRKLGYPHHIAPHSSKIGGGGGSRIQFQGELDFGVKPGKRLIGLDDISKATEEKCKNLGCSLVETKEGIFLSHPKLKPSLFKYKEYQIVLADIASKQNLGVILPTQIGKTGIATLTALHRLNKFPGSKVIFLAPFRPLVDEQVDLDFKRFISGYNIGRITGEIPKGASKKVLEKRMKIIEENDIIVATPQTIRTLIDQNLLNLSDIDVSLLVFDEADLTTKNYDYAWLAKRYVEQAKNTRILALAAAIEPEQEHIDSFIKELCLERFRAIPKTSKMVAPFVDRPQEELIKFTPIQFKIIAEKLDSVYIDSLKKLRKAGYIKEVNSEIKFHEMQEIYNNILNDTGKQNLIDTVIFLRKLKIALENKNTTTFRYHLKDLLKSLRGKYMKEVLKTFRREIEGLEEILKKLRGLNRRKKLSIEELSPFIVALFKEENLYYRLLQELEKYTDVSTYIEKRGLIISKLKLGELGKMSNHINDVLTKRDSFEHLSDVALSMILKTMRDYVKRYGVYELDLFLKREERRKEVSKAARTLLADRRIKEVRGEIKNHYEIIKRIRAAEKALESEGAKLEDLPRLVSDYREFKEKGNGFSEWTEKQTKIASIFEKDEIKNLFDEKENGKMFAIKTLKIIKGENFPSNIMDPRLLKIKEIVSENKDKSIIIFVENRDSVQRVSAMLDELGIDNRLFIGQEETEDGKKGMTQKEQKEVLGAFRSGEEFKVLIATKVLERGFKVAADIVIMHEPASCFIRMINRMGRTPKLVYILCADGTKEFGRYIQAKRKEEKLQDAAETRELWDTIMQEE